MVGLTVFGNVHLSVDPLWQVFTVLGNVDFSVFKTQAPFLCVSGRKFLPSEKFGASG